MCLQVGPETTGSSCTEKADAERYGIAHGFEEEKQNQIVSLDLYLPHTQILPCTSVHSKTVEYKVVRFGTRSTFIGHQSTQKVQFPMHITNDKETNTAKIIKLHNLPTLTERSG